MVPAERKLVVVQPLLLLRTVLTHYMKRKRKLYLIPVLLIFLGAIGYGINYFIEIAFEGNESIVLVDEYDKILSFEELITRKEFKNKVLYIDLWGVYCRPCIEEFQHASELKSRYANKPVEFLYLASPYNRMDDELKWKSAIKKYDLDGYHVLMNTTFYNEIWNVVHRGAR